MRDSRSGFLLACALGAALWLAGCGSGEQAEPPAAREDAAPAAPAEASEAETAPDSETGGTGETGETAEAASDAPIDPAPVGGEAHEHGHADLSVVLEGARLTVTLDAPLANFGLSEGGATDAEIAALEEALTPANRAIAVNTAAACEPESQVFDVRRSGDHAAVTVDFVFNCVQPEALSSVALTMFDRFEGFETVDAIFLDNGEQSAFELTAQAPAVTR